MIFAQANLGNVLTPERVRRYPLVLLAVTLSVYLSSALRSEHWVEPGGQIIGRDFLAFYMAGEMINRGTCLPSRCVIAHRTLM